MKIKEVYRPEPITVGVDEPITTAARLMAREEVGALAVVGAKDVGILSERDVVRAVDDGPDLSATPVRDYASFDIQTAGLDDETSDVAYQMLRSSIRHMPIVQHDEVIGMVSMRDLLALETWS